MASAGPGELKVSPPQSSAPPGKAGRPFRHRGGGSSLKTPAVPRGFGPAGARDLEEAWRGGEKEGRAVGADHVLRSHSSCPMGPRMTPARPAAPSHPQLISWMFGTDQLGRR